MKTGACHADKFGLQTGRLLCVMKKMRRAGDDFPTRRFVPLRRDILLPALCGYLECLVFDYAVALLE